MDAYKEKLVKKAPHGRALSKYLIDKHKFPLHCFFEGKDDDIYYGFRIRHYTGQPVYGVYRCGDRQTVLNVIQRLENQTGRSDCIRLYFIDHDYFKPELECDHLFITPCYSIESLYISPEVFSGAIQSKVDISPKAAVEVCELYERFLTEFCLLIREWNAWLKTQRRLEKEQSAKRFIVRSSHFIKHVCIERDKVLCSWSPLMHPPNDAIDISSETCSIVNQYLDEMGAVDEYRWGRGKFFHLFINRFMNFMRNEFDNKTGLFAAEEGGWFEGVSLANIVKSWTDVAETPEELKTFLQAAKNKVDALN